MAVNFREFVVAQAGMGAKCPNCEKKVSQFEASGLSAALWLAAPTDPDYRCPHCRVELRTTMLPRKFNRIWNWALKEAAASCTKCGKARLLTPVSETDEAGEIIHRNLCRSCLADLSAS